MTSRPTSGRMTGRTSHTRCSVRNSESGPIRQDLLSKEEEYKYVCHSKENGHSKAKTNSSSLYIRDFLDLWLQLGQQRPFAQPFSC